MSSCDCTDCEQKLQSYVDRQLSSEEMRQVEDHLARCRHCARCYELEVTLRRVVKRVLVEPIPPELKAKLAALRTPL